MKKTNGYAPVNGLKMYYEIEGDGDPLVFIPVPATSHVRASSARYARDAKVRQSASSTASCRRGSAARF